MADIESGENGFQVKMDLVEGITEEIPINYPQGKKTHVWQERKMRIFRE